MEYARRRVAFASRLVGTNGGRGDVPVTHTQDDGLVPELEHQKTAVMIIRVWREHDALRAVVSTTHDVVDGPRSEPAYYSSADGVSEAVRSWLHDV
jgi:hypothetical protein